MPTWFTPIPTLNSEPFSIRWAEFECRFVQYWLYAPSPSALHRRVHFSIGMWCWHNRCHLSVFRTQCPSARSLKSIERIRGDEWHWSEARCDQGITCEIIFEQMLPDAATALAEYATHCCGVLLGQAELLQFGRQRCVVRLISGGVYQNEAYARYRWFHRFQIIFIRRKWFFQPIFLWLPSRKRPPNFH